MNVAGAQRMLEERMAGFAFPSVYDGASADSMRIVATALNAYDHRLRQLTASLEVAALTEAKAAQNAILSTALPRQQLIDAATAVSQHALGSEARRLAALDVVRRSDVLLIGAERTARALQEYSEERVRRTVRASWLVAFLLQLIIALIAILVIEPVIRLLQKQHTIASHRSVEFQRLAMVAERTSNAVVITDAARKITWVNDGFSRQAGYTLEEALGKNPGALLQCDRTNPDTIRALRTAMDAGQAFRCEILNRHKEGQYYWLDLSVEPLREHNELVGFLAIETDITEQVNTREALDAQRQLAQDSYLTSLRATELLEEAQAVSRLGSWAYDFASDRTEWSTEVFRLFSRDPAVGAPAFDDILTDYIPADALRLREAVQRAATTGQPYTLVLKTLKGAQGVHYVRGEGRARRDDTGKVVGLFGTVMDVTAAIEREEALLQAQSRAEAASQSKSEFLANMSHEIRTPLTAILGYTDLLRDEAIRTGADESHLLSMSTIRRAGEHLLSVINDILDLSKIEAGRMQVESVETDLPRVLFDVDSLMRSRAAQKGVQLTTRLMTSIPDRVYTDPTRLRQILMNMVGNAAKFTDVGQVEIRISANDGGEHPTLQVSVVDTGAGMTAEQAIQLFQPFMQADTSVTRKYGGTGLGLTICRRLASLMGGDVVLESTALGVGSTFTLTLPLEPVAGAVDVTDLSACVDCPDSATVTDAYEIRLHGRILLAEDGEDNQRLITHHLTRAGAHVVVAEHGRRALELIIEAQDAGAPFQLLVSDMQMPEMDGYTLARTLRAQGRSIPIIALTAHAMAEDRQKCLDAGCDDYASKPIDRGALIASCARWMLHSEPTLSEPDDLFPRLISELHDDPELAELVQMFIEGLPQKIARIEQAYTDGLLNDLARAAHQLKGAAGGYGFPSISNAARHVEQYASSRVTADGTFDPGVDLAEAVTVLLSQCRSAAGLPEQVS